MAKFSGRIRVLLILTFLSKLTFAVQDALKDPSLEIIRQEDAEEGTYTGYNDQTIKTKVETPASIELRPEEILEAETTKVNTAGEEGETDLNSIPDEQSVDQETSPVINKENNVQSESKASDESESGEHEERNDSNFKRGDFLETNNEIYDTGEHTYRENAYPEENIVENNEQQDSSQNREDATVAEEDQNKYPSENGEILDTEPEKVNFEIKNIKNEVIDDNNNVQSLDQQVKPIAQSFVADEDERITNEHEIENKIKTDEENEGSYETVEEVSYDKTSVSQENEIKNVHQNEQISEDHKSLEEDMTNDITSVKEDEPENVVEDDIEESPKENEIVQEIHESDESTSVNDESDEIESSIEDEEEEKEENEENENEEKLNSEPEEEEWEPQEGENYQETVEYRENMRPEVVLLGETIPFNEHEISDEKPHDAEKEEEAENFVEVGDNEHIRRTEDDENKGGSQIQEKPVDEEEEEEHREIEEEEEQSNQTQKKPGEREEHKEYDETEDEEDTEIEKETDKGNQIEENYVDAENKLEDHEKEDDKEKEEEDVEEEQEMVEPPPAFYEAQNSPFRKMDEEIQPAEEDIDPCLQGPDSGFGKHAHWRFFYNSSVKECQNFLYGGRGGNANNFETLEDCLKACNTRHS